MPPSEQRESRSWICLHGRYSADPGPRGTRRTGLAGRAPAATAPVDRRTRRAREGPQEQPGDQDYQDITLTSILQGPRQYGGQTCGQPAALSQVLGHPQTQHQLRRQDGAPADPDDARRQTLDHAQADQEGLSHCAATVEVCGSVSLRITAMAPSMTTVPKMRRTRRLGLTYRSDGAASPISSTPSGTATSPGCGAGCCWWAISAPWPYMRQPRRPYRNLLVRQLHHSADLLRCHPGGPAPARPHRDPPRRPVVRPGAQPGLVAGAMRLSLKP